MTFDIVSKEDGYLMTGKFGDILLRSFGYTIPLVFENMADVIRSIESSTSIKIKI